MSVAVNLAVVCLLIGSVLVDPSMAFSVSMMSTNECSSVPSSRRGFLTKTSSAVVFATVPSVLLLDQQQPANAAPEILVTPSGIKYAILKRADEKRSPFDKDIVAVEYTGYLSDGTIFGA